MGKNGKLRSPWVPDAQKMKLVPGVSTISAVESAPALTNWLIDQACLSMATLPRLPDETIDAFIVRAKEDSKEQVRKAAARGTSIHAALQGAFEGKPTAANDIPYVESVRAWIEQRYGLDGWLAESSFASPLGYGGKVDLHHPTIPCVIDFKGKDFDESKQGIDLAWPNNAMQLAAYRYGLGLPRADCVNIFFSRTVPGLIRAREWDEDEIAENWEAFKALHRVWCIRKKFNPAFDSREAA